MTDRDLYELANYIIDIGHALPGDGTLCWIKEWRPDMYASLQELTQEPVDDVIRLLDLLGSGWYKWLESNKIDSVTKREDLIGLLQLIRTAISHEELIVGIRYQRIHGFSEPRPAPPPCENCGDAQ